MPLGYENTGIGPKLISHAGDVMTESIRRIGEQIQKDVVQHRTDKQVAGFLQEAQSLDINAPNFQGQLVGTLAKYPMAAGDQRALLGAKLLQTGWENQQRMTLADKKFKNQEALYRSRYGDPSARYGDSPLPMNDPLGQPEIFKGSALMGGVNPMVGMGAGMAEQGAQPSGGVVSENRDGALFDGSTLAVHNQLKALGVSPKKGQQVMADYVGRKAASELKGPLTKPVAGVGLAQYNPDTETWDVVVKGNRPRKFLNAGDHWQDVDNGERIDISMTPGQKAAGEARTAAADDKRSQQLMQRATKNIDGEITDLQKKRASLETSIRDRQKVKEPTPEQTKELGIWQEQHMGIEKDIDGLMKERRELGIEQKAVKKLDKETAAGILQEVGGDKEKARARAKELGYDL